MDIPKGKRDRRVSAILVSITKSEENYSTGGLIKHFDKHPGDLERCELSRHYCRALLHLCISEIDPAVLQEILVWMAGEDAADGTKAVDSSGFSISRYIDWCHAKYGTISVKLFAKLHIIHTMQGKICAAIVTPGKANNSPYLREMIRMLPHGSGDLLGGGVYCSIANCNAIRDSGRWAIIKPDSNYTIKGFNARAEMLRFLEEHPGTFYRLLRKRNNVESVFASMK